MKKETIQGICLLIASILIFILLLLTAGCANPLYKPFKRVSTSVFPEYRKYVKQDPKLTKEQKSRRIKGVDHVDKLLRDYREVEGD